MKNLNPTNEVLIRHNMRLLAQLKERGRLKKIMKEKQKENGKDSN